ncbi:MAG: SMP-30/gluconolactonase/LRE family protein [Planctomycetota bacterium]
MTQIRTAEPLPVPASDELKFLPEGPCALTDSEFSWVAIQHGMDSTSGSLNRFNLLTNQNQTFELPGRPGFAFPCSGGDRFVVGCERSLGFIDTASGEWTPFCDGVDADVSNTIINDGLVFDDNLIFGTKDLEFATEKAGLYLFRGSDRQLIRLRNDQICSNGKAIYRDSEGHTRLLDIDSPTRRIVSYPIDVNAGTLGSPTTLIDLTGDPAVPDGAIMTPDGTGVIVSMFLPKAAEFGETRWYDLATGTTRCIWQTAGSPQNTCPALVRHQDRVVLVITTAVENMNGADQAACQNAGRLFMGETDFDVASFQLPPLFPDRS